MDQHPHERPLNDAELDRILSNASQDLDNAWKRRMLPRLRADAAHRGDTEAVQVLDGMIAELDAPQEGE